MRKRIIATICTVAMFATFLVGCAAKNDGASDVDNASATEETVTFKLALVDPDTSPYAKGAHAIADAVDAATDGKIKIEVNAGGALGGERDTLELAMSNNLDIATCANSVLTNFIPEMGILDQAYLWKNTDEAHAAVDGALGDLIKAKAEEQGLHVVGFMESGFRNTFSTKPIETVDDFNGVTIRTMENQYHQAAFESFGAMPIAMSYNDVFTALQQGTIDACENATANCWNSGFYEVTKHITNTQHAFVYILLCMSDDAWNKIPEDMRQTFLDAVQEGVEEERGFLVEANEDATEKLEEKGVAFHDIDISVLQEKYQETVESKGFEFDSEWQAAVDEAIASCEN